MLLVKVYVLVTTVTVAPTAPAQFTAAIKEVVLEVVPARLCTNVRLVVTAEVIVPTVVTVTTGGAYQAYIAPIFWANGSVNSTAA